MIFHSNFKWRKHVTLYQKYVLIKKGTYSWCITMKIPWYIEGIEDCFHTKNYPSSSHGFGLNKNKNKEIFVLHFLESLVFLYIKNRHAKTTRDNSMKITVHEFQPIMHIIQLYLSLNQYIIASVIFWKKLVYHIF